MSERKETISFVWWLALPIIFFLGSAYLQIWGDENMVQGLLAESGPVEILQFIIVSLACVAAGFTLHPAIRSKAPLLIGWTALAFLGTFYISGEEISWGQHIFLWSTPESWMQVNDHHETNLHNTTAWLDQKPRTLIEIGMLVGGIAMPLYRKKRHSALLEKNSVLLPPDYLWVTAAVLWITKIMKDADAHIHFMSLTRTSELNEIYMYYFMVLYLIAFRLRLVQINNR